MGITLTRVHSRQLELSTDTLQTKSEWVNDAIQDDYCNLKATESAEFISPISFRREKSIKFFNFHWGIMKKG